MKKSIGSGRVSVYNIILKTLQTGDKYGYEICKEVEEKTNGAYILKQPSLYSGLKRLEAQGDIKSYWRDSALGGRRHYYTMTESGKERLENSQFNWQDARDDIVVSLFEKSAVEQTIESVQRDIEDVKQSTEITEQYNRDIDEVLESTKELFENKQNEAQETNKNTNDVGDLFSMFKTVEQTNEQTENNENENVENETVKNEFNKIDDAETQNEELVTENLEREEITESVVEQEENSQIDEYQPKQNEQLDLFSFVNTYQKQETEKHVDEESINQTENEETENIQTQLQNYAENDDAKENAENESQEILENQKNNDEEKLDENNLENKNFDKQEKSENVSFEEKTDRVVYVQKNQTNWIDEYRQNSQDEISDSFASSSAKETQEKTFSRFEPYSTDFDSFDFSNAFGDLKEKDEINANETRNSTEIYESSYQQLIGETLEDKSNQTAESEQLSQNENEQSTSFENMTDDSNKTAENKAFDYDDIFGDLMTKKESAFESKNNETEKQAKNNFADEETQNTSDDFAYQNADENKAEKNENHFDDLPRNTDALNNINLTLMKDANLSQNNSDENSTNNYFANENNSSSSNDFEPYDTSAFEVQKNSFYDDTFEKSNKYESNSANYDLMNRSYQAKQNINEDVKNQQTVYTENTKDLSFDKKYANTHNNFEVPDYEVRYYKKHSADNSATRFLSINKLNLFDGFVLAILICFFTTISLSISSLNGEIGGFQSFLYIVSYLIAAAILLLNFLKYISNKNKKVQHLRKVEMSFRLFIAILVIILTISINLFAGINFNNIASFSASFVLPMFYSIIILINYPLKKFLSKFPTFYN